MRVNDREMGGGGVQDHDSKAKLQSVNCMGWAGLRSGRAGRSIDC